MYETVKSLRESGYIKRLEGTGLLELGYDQELGRINFGPTNIKVSELKRAIENKSQGERLSGDVLVTADELIVVLTDMFGTVSFNIEAIKPLLN